MTNIKQNKPIFLHAVIAAIMLFVYVSPSNAQVYQWKKIRYELIVGAGVSNFMGDVGAPKNEGLAKYFWTNVNTWRPVINVGGRMALSERHKVKTMLTSGWLYANDAYGAKLTNQYEVRTFISELSAQYEFYIIREQSKRNIYRFLGSSQRFKNLKLPLYVFGGISGVFFNPKTLFDGKWVALQPYQTEVLPGGKDKYSRFAVAVPVGGGIKFKVARYISINIEAGWRLAFTDYMDDLGSGEYPDFSEVLENGDYERMALSWRGHGRSYMDPELIEDLEENVSLEGNRRGAGDWFDQYQFVTFSLNFKLQTGRKGIPRLRLYR